VPGSKDLGDIAQEPVRKAATIGRGVDPALAALLAALLGKEQAAGAGGPTPAAAQSSAADKEPSGFGASLEEMKALLEMLARDGEGGQ